MSGAAINRVIDRLAGVRANGTGRWMAKCPSHADRSPSLSIRELDDGRVLINCFGGCGAGDVLAAIGLKMADLFDKPIQHHLPPIRGGGFNARELLELTAHEVTVAAMLALQATLAPLSADALNRLIEAASRLGKAQAMLDGR